MWSSEAVGTIAQVLRQRKGRMLIGLVMMLFNRTAALVLPASPQYVLDRIVLAERWDLVPVAVTAILVAAITEGLSAVAIARVLGVAAQRSIAQVRTESASHVVRLPLAYFVNNQSGAIATGVISDPEGLRTLIGSGMIQLLGASLSALGAILILFWMDPKMTAAMIVVFGMFWLALRTGFSALGRAANASAARLSHLRGSWAETVRAIRVVRVSGAEGHASNRFREDALDVSRVTSQWVVLMATVSASGPLVMGAVAAVTVGLGVSAIRSHDMTVGQWMSYLMLAQLAVAPIAQFATNSTNVLEAIAGLSRVTRLLGTAKDESSGTHLVSGGGEVCCDGVSFSYDDGSEALSNVSMRIPSGSVIGIAGHSGSGKSTLISLVLRLYRPSVGRLTLNGISIEKYDHVSYRSGVTAVLQESYLVDGTVLDNITLGLPTSASQDVQRACEASGCSEFVGRLSEGLMTYVGEAGCRLSGGQRQRIAMARALLANPEVLLLDEATSSLDAESATAIMNNVIRSRVGRTTIIATHSLELLRGADYIYVFERGRVVESGSFEELIALNGVFAAMRAEQSVGACASR